MAEDHGSNAQAQKNLPLLLNSTAAQPARVVPQSRKISSS